MKKVLRLSVHRLVDFLLRTGDIDNRVFNRTTMNEGGRIHASYQKEQDSNYLSEYPLSHTFIVNGVTIVLEGRADGIIKRKNGDYVVDEIKTTVSPLNEFREGNLEWHLGQARCYAYMFSLEKNLKSIGVKLTYIRQGKEKEKLIDEYTLLKEDLEQYVYSLLEDYMSFYAIIARLQEEKNESIKPLKFPFQGFRKGQRELSKYAYALAKNGGKLFVEAPTGIGKTMSTLYPFIKALPLDLDSKIFYLTAKTPGKESAYHAVNLLKDNGLVLNDIVITAKDKICFCKNGGCNPDECPYAKGYYNKIKAVIHYAIANHTTFDHDVLVELARTNEVCPFEMELDLSLFCDIIICDYNYMFDPISYMKRYFDDDSSHYLALVDEAHNLIDRSREMYSASISYEKFLEAKKSMRHVKHVKIKGQLSKINKMFLSYLDIYDDGYHPVDDFHESIYQTLERFVETYQSVSKEDRGILTKELLDFYLDTIRFLKICEFYSDRFISYFEVKNENIILSMNCLDASRFLMQTFKKIRAAVIFSATLSPIEYYEEMLGGETTDAHLLLPSPFPRENLKIMLAPKVSIKYKNRNSSYDQVVEYIDSFVKNKIGNFFIYAPSYEYKEIIEEYPEFKKYKVFSQKRDMTDKEKEEFLLNFKSNPEETTLGFLVLGGAFGEGVDLVSDRLIGAVIIGIGLPRINFMSDQISEYYRSFDLPGHDYAYVNPGMNKVMQAVGRVIRSEKDKGAVLLIDERYMSSQYRSLFRQEWQDYEVVYSPYEVEEITTKFFNE